MPSRLRAHAAALLVVLLSLLPVARWQEVFQADEAVALAQAHALLDGDGWRLPNPSPELDPAAEALPLDNVDVFADGSYAPFAKHPAYPVLLAGTIAVLGDVGPLVLSVLGTWVASIVAALLAERSRAGTGVLALWITGVASPLLFDAYLVIAHAVGAAVAGGLALAVFGDPEARLRPALVAAAVAPGVALPLLRTEGVLLVGAVAAVLVVGGALGRQRGRVVLGAVVGLGGVAGAGLDRLGRELVLGDAVSTFAVGTAGGGRGVIQDRLDAARLTLLEPSFFGSPGASALVAGTVLLLGGAILLRRAAEDRAGPLLLLAGGAMVALRLASTDDPVPGLLVAFPLLLVGGAWLTRADLDDARSAPPGIAAALFAAAVAATQYAGGGGGGWGGRYFAIGLPLATPLVAVGVDRLVRSLPGRSRRPAVLGLAVATSALAVLAVASLHRGRTETGDLVERVAAARGERADPVVTTAGALGRFAWREVDAGGWLSAAPDDLEALLERLVATEERVVLVSRNLEDDLDAAEGSWDVGSREQVGETWWIVDLAATRP